MASVELKNLGKRFGDIEIIKGIDLAIEHGEFVVFVGPSGCGKSTLLRVIAGLEDISFGSLEIGGKCVNDLPPKERSIAMVFQSYALFPHLTVFENMAFGLQIAGASKAEIEQKVRNAAQILKMEHLLQRKPKALSGGQRQRVAIGRAIVRSPEVFLFDEPLSNLDAELRVNTRAEIAKLHRDLGATMIYVTHDQVEAMTLADKIVVLDSGKVSQFGRPLELYHSPKNSFVAGFIGSPKMNFLPVHIVHAGPSGITVASSIFEEHLIPVHAGNAKPGDVATMGIRPEHISETATPGIRLTGEVGLVERLGHETFIGFKPVSGPAVGAMTDGYSFIEIGQIIEAYCSPNDCHLFDSDGNAFERLQVPEIAKHRKFSGTGVISTSRTL